MEQTNPPNKRRRVALACSNCRHRKSRCDGKRPKCSLCCELGSECVYEQAGITTNITVGRSYLERLEKRLVDIESALHRVQSNEAAPSTSSTIVVPGENHESQNAGTWDENDSSGLSPPLVYQSIGGIGEVDTAEDAIDGMGVMKFTDEEDWGYFGPSSNIAFLRHIGLAMARGGDLSQALPSPSNHWREVSGGMSISRPHHVEGNVNFGTFDQRPAGVNMFALPSEVRTWSLIKEYFQKTGQLLPFVHEESFCASYFEMKRNNFTMARRTWLGLLNIILAMATTLQVEGPGSAEERIKESDVYYQRANGLCEKESRRNISLESVQYLLILGQYLQGTQKSVQAWTVHGLAITTALQLGLHSPKTNREFPSLECEIRKRAWFGCILLDRTLSMTFGRPAMIHESYIKLDLPVPSLQVVGQTPQSTENPQMDGFAFIATIKLYNIMYRIIDTCYGQNLGFEAYHTIPELISFILKSEDEMEEWKIQLGELQMRVYDVPMTTQTLDKIDVEDKFMARFVNVLSMRYHNLQILLHRPILERFLEICNSGAAARGKVQQLGITAVESCVHSAVIVISIVHTVVKCNGWSRDLLGAWNYSLFYTFNAALVIFAALHVAQNEIQNDVKQRSRWEFVEQSLPYFNMAIEALKSLDRGNQVVERCSSYLSQLNLPPNPFDDASMNNLLSHNIQHATQSISRSGGGNMVGGDYSSNSSVWSTNLGMASRQVPMEIDLNEFMLDTDFDFLTRTMRDEGM